LLLRLKTDLLSLLNATAEATLENLADPAIEFDERAAVCVVLASAGYPGDYQKGFAIEGIEEAEKNEDVKVFHAGTKLEHGKVITAGGRVLGVTALGKDIAEAQAKAYNACEIITFNNKYFRKDIASKAINWLRKNT